MLKSPKKPVGLLLDTREDYEKFPEKPHACLTDLQYTDEVATGIIHKPRGQILGIIDPLPSPFVVTFAKLSFD